MRNQKRESLPARRSGLTLAEVLVSMGILVIGLLGVAALFPVGGHYMQTGDVADRAGAIAQAALDDAIIRGHLDPQNWLVLDTLPTPTAPQPVFVNPVTGIGRRGDGQPVDKGGLEDDLDSIGGSMFGTQMAIGAMLRSARYGDAFVIDPLGLAETLAGAPNTLIVTNLAQNGVLANFPALPPPIQLNAQEWEPWQTAAQVTWPVRRVTTVHDSQRLSNSVAYRFNEPPAAALFTASDDLALILPDSEDDPSRGRWATWSSGTAPRPLAASRQSRGDFSWIISVSPGSSEARDALATRPGAFPYDISVVVFHKRVLGAGFDGSREAERLVKARVVTTGTAGGELLLERRPAAEDPVNESPFEDLRTGEYVMLTGPHPLSTNARPMLFLQWYRVLTIEDSGQPVLDNTSTQQSLNEDRVLVSLRGPDWPWRATGDLSQNAALPNDLRVAIIPGAVAVHTKTMRLEAGTPWAID